MDKAVVCSGCGHAVDEPGSGSSGVSGQPWNFLIMIALVGLTLVIPPAGIVFGVIGLMEEAKKVQGAVLTTMGIFMTLLLTAIILGL